MAKVLNVSPMARIFVSCIDCNKPLTNPISQALGKGPVCRVGGKNRSLNRESLFAMRANFNWGIMTHDTNQDLSKVLWIVDLDLVGKSVTNDMENVLDDISLALGSEDDIRRYKLMYKDSQGTWDGIRIHESQVDYPRRFPVQIYSLNLRSQDAAAAKIWDAQADILNSKTKAEKRAAKVAAESVIEE